MVLILPKPIPAKTVLSKENIPVLDGAPQGADILDVAVLNLMPDKYVTETQLLRLLSVSPLPVRATFLRPGNHVSKSTPDTYLEEHYRTHADIVDQRFDAMIVTGAPVEHLPFEHVTYWEELRQLMDWARDNVTSSLYICWGAQAALHHRYGIPKVDLDAKLFGNFRQHLVESNSPLFHGFDDEFHVPQSRYTGTSVRDLQGEPEVEILAESGQSGVYIAGSRDGREFYMSGHPEYDHYTLHDQYQRDVSKGVPIAVPAGYYPDDDPKRKPVRNWQAHGRLLYGNWIQRYVLARRP